MHTWLDVIRGLGTGSLLLVAVAIAVRVLAKALTNQARMLETIPLLSNLQQWANRNEYTILLRQQVWDSPFHKNGGGPPVFRVVVQDTRGERRWGWVRCGKRLDARWAESESLFPPPSSVTSPPPKDDPLWDHEVDA